MISSNLHISFSENIFFVFIKKKKPLKEISEDIASIFFCGMSSKMTTKKKKKSPKTLDK